MTHEGEPKFPLLIINYTSCWVLELSCVLWQHICVLENTGVLEIKGEKYKPSLSSSSGNLQLLPSQFALELPSQPQRFLLTCQGGKPHAFQRSCQITQNPTHETLRPCPLPSLPNKRLFVESS